MSLRRFWSELRSRKVPRTAVGYLLLAVGLLEGFQLVYPSLSIPDAVYDGLVIGAVIGFPVVLVISWFYDIGVGGLERAGSSAAVADGVAIDPNSIAVLPFSDMSPEGDQKYFGDGVADEIINGLAQVKGLKVAARTSAFTLRERGADVGEISERLRVAQVLEGSVRRHGGHLRVTAQLVDASTGFQLWSETYERGLDDIFAIQREITTSVVERIRPRGVRPSDDGAARVLTKRQEAYDLYLRGLHYLNQTGGVPTAFEYFHRSIAADPDFALPYAGIARGVATLAAWGMVSSEELKDRARTAARRALELDDGLAECHHSFGHMAGWVDWDWQAAIRAQQRAIELNPANPESIGMLGSARFMLGDEDAGLELIGEAVEQDPFSAYIGARIALFRLLARRPEEAWAAIERVLGYHPTSLDALALGSLALSELGRYEDAVKMLTGVLQAAGRIALFVGVLGYIHARAGQAEQARALLDELESRAASEPFGPMCMAIVTAGLGLEDETVRLLGRAVEERDSTFMAMYRLPAFDLVRSDPRYRALVDRIGLAP